MIEATVLVDGRAVWYAVDGDLGARPPLVCVPGGPGMSHDYLAPLAALRDAGRAIVFYDALGSGRSERPVRTWSTNDYVRELEMVVKALAVPRYHVFAHSAAGLAAYPYAIGRAPGLSGLVLGACPASIPALHRAIRPLLELSDDELARFERAERNEIARDTRYIQVANRYGQKYMCRMSPPPLGFVQSLQRMNADALRSIKGGLLFYTTAQASFDVTHELGNIAAKTLVTCGGHDFLSPEMSAKIAQAIPNGELAVFDQSAHIPHYEQPVEYVARLRRFLDECD
jgi:proline iminopeptidase